MLSLDFKTVQNLDIEHHFEIQSLDYRNMNLNDYYKCSVHADCVNIPGKDPYDNIAMIT